MTAIPGVGGPRPEAAPPALRVGQFYLDVPGRRLHCLNDTARQLRDEGVPLTDRDPARPHLRALDGSPTTADLPYAVALRERRPAEAAYRFAVPGQPERHLHWSAAPLKDPAGQVAGVFLTITSSPPPPDWTALAGLAHDLRTPLHTLGMLLTFLDPQAAPRTPGSQVEILAMLRRAGERAQQIARDLLEYCRAPSGKAPGTRHGWAALEPFLREAVAEQWPAAERKGLTLGSAVEATRGWQIFTDRGGLARVFANLLVNAVRYTPAGGRVILTATWEVRGGERVLVLGVLDTGVGISPEEQESIFQPFERGRGGRESDALGSGIGLAVVDTLTRELGLSRECQSEAGLGTLFNVLVPQRLLRMAPAGAPSAV